MEGVYLSFMGQDFEERTRIGKLGENPKRLIGEGTIV